MDKRNKLWTVMDYQITIGFPLFFEVRKWCWDRWGPGIEAEHYINYHFLGDSPPVQGIPWAWECAKFQGKPLDRGRIYLWDDAQATDLRLTWCEDGRDG